MARISESKPAGLSEALAVRLLNLGVEVANAMPGDEPPLIPAKPSSPTPQASAAPPATSLPPRPPASK